MILSLENIIIFVAVVAVFLHCLGLVTPGATSIKLNGISLIMIYSITMGSGIYLFVDWNAEYGKEASVLLYLALIFTIMFFAAAITFQLKEIKRDESTNTH